MISKGFAISWSDNFPVSITPISSLYRPINFQLKMLFIINLVKCFTILNLDNFYGSYPMHLTHNVTTNYHYKQVRNACSAM